MNQDFERVVIVTGAATGIGRATACRLAQPGTALLLHTRRNREGLNETAGRAAGTGGAVRIVLGDLAEPGVAESLVSVAREAYGRVDQIVSNAGQADRRPFGELRAEDLAYAFRGMPEAFLRLVNAALPDLSRSSWGRVVVVSSFVAHLHGANGTLFPATSAAKAAVEALAKELAFQLAPTGTTVNCVAPGFTRKDAGGHAALPSGAWEKAAAATPMRKLAEPADVAAAVDFLTSREAGHVTGQTIHVDGGLTLISA